jgi:hypothetical protein
MFLCQNAEHFLLGHRLALVSRPALFTESSSAAEIKSDVSPKIFINVFQRLAEIFASQSNPEMITRKIE